MRKNEQFWADKIDEESHNLRSRLPDSMMVMSEEQYAEIDFNLKLGEVLEFYTLGDLADILHIPVPFIENEYFLKRGSFEDFSVFKKVSEQECERMKLQRNEFRLIFKKIVENILTLIENY